MLTLLPLAVSWLSVFIDREGDYWESLFYLVNQLNPIISHIEDVMFRDGDKILRSSAIFL
jgi:hypothetical protein